MKQGVIYTGRSENDKDSYGSFTKIGMTQNYKTRINGYNTNKGVSGWKYCNIWRPLNCSVNIIEKLFKDVTKRFRPTGQIVHGTEVRYATPEQLAKIFRATMERFKIIYEDVDPDEDGFSTKYTTRRTGKNGNISSLTPCPKPQLYEHQKTAVKSATRIVQDSWSGANTRGRIYHPTASGKTRCQLEILAHSFRNAQRTKALIVVPSLSLITQCYTNLRRFFPHDLELMIVASKNPTRFGDNNVTVNPSVKTIKYVLENIEKDIVVITTYASIERKLLGHGMSFDLALYDEAHHTVTKNASFFTDTLLTIGCRLFFTATPKNTKNRVSMNNERFYGQVLHKLTIREAIELKVLTDFKTVISICNVDADDITHTVASIIAIIGEKHVSKIICYSNTQEYAKTVKAALEDATDYNIHYVDSQTSEVDRERVFDFFRDRKYTGRVDILCNVKVVTEGVDLPLADTVCFTQSKLSKHEIVQTVGRVLRRNVDDKGVDLKPYSYVLIPSAQQDFSTIRAVLKCFIDECVVNVVGLKKGDVTAKINDLIDQIQEATTGKATSSAEFDLKLLEKCLSETVLRVKTSGVSSRTDKMMEFAKKIANKDGTFQVSKIYEQAAEYGYERLGIGGKTPKQTLSRHITEHMTKSLGLFERCKVGTYRIVKV